MQTVNTLRVIYVHSSAKGSASHIFEMVPEYEDEVINTAKGKMRTGNKVPVRMGKEIVRKRNGTSYCTKSAFEIGKEGLSEDELKESGSQPVESKDRPLNRPLCDACLRGWKNDPRSPYYQMMNGQGLK